MNVFVIERENDIWKIEPKWQYTYRHLEAKQIKQIKENSKQNLLHKTQ